MKLLASIAILLTLAGMALAGERGSTPQGFESGYQLPAAPQPQARPAVMEYVDLALLAAGLAAGAYFSLKLRKRWPILLLMLAAMAYFGFYRKGCICPIGAIQNVALAVFDSSYTIPLAAIGMFALPLLATLIWGRTFCGSLCPLGAVQDIVVVKPIRLPPWLEHSLGLLPYIYLAAAVAMAASGGAFLICQNDPFVGFYRLQGTMQMLMIGGLFLVMGMFLARPYCRFLCPYGAILRVLSAVAWKRPLVTPSKCVQCRLCEDACPFGAIQKPTVILPARHKLAGKGMLAGMLALLPILVALGFCGGTGAGKAIAARQPLPALAAEALMEDLGQLEAQSPQLKAFRLTGQTSGQLFDQVANLQSKFALAGGLAGAFIGAVFGCKLISVTTRRRREDYGIDASRCVSCGRCFSACPLDRPKPTSGAGQVG